MNKNTFLDKFNVCWDSQSQNSGENIPCGGHDVGLNVWVEEGKLWFYLDRNGCFDENNVLLKLGRFCIETTPAFLENPSITFTQTLRLGTGDLEIKATQPDGECTTWIIWCETERPAIHVEVSSSALLRCKVSYHSWRFEDRVVPPEQRLGCYSALGTPGDIITYADALLQEQDGIAFYHQNQKSIVFFTKL